MAISTTAQLMHAVLKVVTQGYHRATAEGVEHVPAGGVLIVSNHSGGVLSMDGPLIATALREHAGIERDVRLLAHDLLMNSPLGGALAAAGLVAASRENAVRALQEGAATIVFPGGEWESSRPSHLGAKLDFKGRVGYARTAIEAGVPILPVVSLGGQEAQLIVSRGAGIARTLGRLTPLRAAAAPIALGFPFGVSVGIPQFPLPAKIATRFLEPIDPTAEFGPDPDPAEVDAAVRSRMQVALDDMARQRRLPVLG